MLTVRNWGKRQAKMSNGKAAPWLKVYRDLLRDHRWAALSDAEKGQLISVWLVARLSDGTVPDDAQLVQKMCGLDNAPNLKKFISLGFMLTSCAHNVNNISTKCTPREREEIDTISVLSLSSTPTASKSRFGEFWDAYPKKVEKKRARQKWVSRKLDRIADQILADIQARKEKDRKWLEGYVPNPTTYINGDRWEDAIESAEKVPTDHAEIRKLMTANNIDPRGKDWSWHECRRQVAMATGMQL